MLNATPTLTPEQFLFWLRGFLEAHPDPHVAADRIAAKAQQVQTSQPLGWPYQQPYTFGVQPLSTITSSYGGTVLNIPNGHVKF